MPRLLASYPLSCTLALGTSSEAGPAELPFGLLESDGAARIISTHMVAFHLREVFDKLDIKSQVALVRIALEHARPEAAQTP